MNMADGPDADPTSDRPDSSDDGAPGRWAIGVVDVENDFCEGGSLAVPGGAAAAARIHDWLLGQARRYATRFATVDRHPADLPGHFAPSGTEPNYVDQWPPHCVDGTSGAEFHPALLSGATESALFDAVFAKGATSAAYSGFEGWTADGMGLAEWLAARDISGIELTGIATEHCVQATAADALSAGLRVRIVTDLCAGLDPEAVGSALRSVGDRRRGDRHHD